MYARCVHRADRDLQCRVAAPPIEKAKRKAKNIFTAAAFNYMICNKFYYMIGAGAEQGAMRTVRKRTKMIRRTSANNETTSSGGGGGCGGGSDCGLEAHNMYGGHGQATNRENCFCAKENTRPGFLYPGFEAGYLCFNARELAWIRSEDRCAKRIKRGTLERNKRAIALDL